MTPQETFKQCKQAIIDQHMAYFNREPIEEKPFVPTAESRAFSEYARLCAGKTRAEWYKKEEK